MDIGFNKGFKETITNVFKELKKVMLKEVKEVKEDMMIMSHQIENINKETEIVKEIQMEILELKSIITNMKIH